MSLPYPRFIAEVNERIATVCTISEVIGKEHEDHAVFRQVHDEELLLWMHRCG